MPIHILFGKKMKKAKIAFVAMKFDSDSWNDKRYKVICDAVEEAGYKPLRADQIRSSGPGTAEVCEYLRTAELVIIDSTGDSHNVSYELGYCHGIQRPHEKTVLLRNATSPQIPFNFRHYRFRKYNDLRHLRRLLRDWFGISTPLLDQQLGFTFCFSILDKKQVYGNTAAEAIVSALLINNFSGRCEYYAGDGSSSMFGISMSGLYLVSVGLKNRKNEIPELKWWKNFQQSVSDLLHDSKVLEIDERGCEYGEMIDIRASWLPRGVVEFSDGHPVTILNREKYDSWFIGVINELINEGNVE